jgi:hypothetical protein
MNQETLVTSASPDPKVLELSTLETSHDQLKLEDDVRMQTFLRRSIWFWWSALIAWVIIDLIWGLEMFDNSIQGTIAMQTIHNGFWVWYNNTWFAITDFLWSWWPLIAVFCYPDKRVALKTFTLRLIMMWLKNNLKLIYLDNRPNIVSKDIIAITCRCEFGKPSGTLINTTTILMFIFWDLFARHPRFKWKCRVASLFVAKIITVQVLFTVMWMGLHSYNQMIYAALVSIAFFYLFAYYDRYFLKFWFHLIDHKANPALTRKFQWVSAVITVLVIAIYAGLLLGRWNVKDFSIALKGACPNCAYVNWCWETILQDTSFFGFPCAVAALAIRSHTWTDNPNYIKQNCNLRGLLRFSLTFICWMPISIWYWPAFTNFVANSMSTPIKGMIATALTWVFLPWLFEKWGLKIDGDIAEYTPKDYGTFYAKMPERRLGTDEDKRLNADIVVK